MQSKIIWLLKFVVKHGQPLNVIILILSNLVNITNIINRNQVASNHEMRSMQI
jgi:hypothetical protein